MFFEFLYVICVYYNINRIFLNKCDNFCALIYVFSSLIFKEVIVRFGFKSFIFAICF